MLGFAEMRGGMGDRERDLVLKCVFGDLRLPLNLGLGFQVLVSRVCLMVCVDRPQWIQIVICVLLTGLVLVGSAGHLRARALLAASEDSGTRKVAGTGPSIGRRPRRHAA